MIRDATESDFVEITRIYNHYIRHSVATFEEVELRPDELLRRFQQIKSTGFDWLVVQASQQAVAQSVHQAVDQAGNDQASTPTTSSDPFDRSQPLLGYAYSSRWKDRSAYRHSAEISVYLDPDATSRGLGSELYQVLLDRLRGRSIRAVMAGITLPNPASVALHQKFGMTQVAHFRQVGFKFDQWLDVGYWQLLMKLGD